MAGVSLLVIADVSLLVIAGLTRNPPIGVNLQTLINWEKAD
jgi:hypothetical protein